MARSIRPDEIVRLARDRGARPIDVLNLISYSDKSQYRIYGAIVLPMIYAVGGSIRWGGQHVARFAGDPVAEDLIVVRYPSIRRFLFMTMNPFYLGVANPFRKRGVRYFEASFTRPDEPRPFRDKDLLLAVHFSTADSDALASVRKLVVGLGGEYVYSSVEHSPLSFLVDPGATDPNPLSHKQLALFAFPDVGAAERASGAVGESLSQTSSRTSLQAYRRSRWRDFRPRFSG